MFGGVHVQDGTGAEPVVRRADRIIDQCPPARAEVARITAETPDVLVAGDGPQTGRVLVHRRLGPQCAQHLVVVRPDEEGGVPRVDGVVGQHGLSVLCTHQPIGGTDVIEMGLDAYLEYTSVFGARPTS